jgi:hypothetical protein
MAEAMCGRLDDVDWFIALLYYKLSGAPTCFRDCTKVLSG